MDLHGRADWSGQQGRDAPRPRCPDVDGDAVRLFEEALAGIESGRSPAWLPTWAFRKARGIRRRHSPARGWLGGHLGFVEDLAVREACERHGLTSRYPQVYEQMSPVGQAVAGRRYGLDRRPDVG